MAALATTITTTAASISEQQTAKLWRHLVDNNMTEPESPNSGDATSYSIASWIAIVIFSLSAVGILLSIGSILFLYRFRRHQIISVGQPPFLCLICFGALLLSISVSLNTTGDSSGRTQESLNASCITWIWCVSVGDLIIYLALVCKLWRVQKVSHFRKGQTILVRHVIWPLVCVVLVAIGILIAWTVVNPPYYKREIVEGEGGKLHFIGICYYDDGGIFQLSLTTIFIATISVVFWLSLKTRKIPETLSDSRRITQTLLVHLILGIVLGVINLGIVIESATKISGSIDKEDKRFDTTLRAGIFLTNVFYQFFVGMVSIGFLVIPKIYYVRYEQTHGRLPSGIHKLVEGRVTVVVNNERLASAKSAAAVPESSVIGKNSGGFRKTMAWNPRFTTMAGAGTMGYGLPKEDQSYHYNIGVKYDDCNAIVDIIDNESQLDRDHKGVDGGFDDIKCESQDFKMEMESSISSVKDNDDSSSIDGIDN